MHGFWARRGSEAGKPEVALKQRPRARDVSEHHRLNVRVAGDRMELQRLLALAQYELTFVEFQSARLAGLLRVLERVRRIGVRRLDNHPQLLFVSLLSENLSAGGGQAAHPTRVIVMMM